MGVKGKKAGSPAPKKQTPPAANVKAVHPVQPKPKQQRLPGTEDPKIEELHTAAQDYAELRDQRMELTKLEFPAKEALRQLMHKHNRTSYVCDGLEVKIVTTDETVKVKVLKGKDDE